MTQHGRPAEVSPPKSVKIWLRLVLGGLAVVTACALLKYFQGSETAKADSPWQQTAAADSSPATPPAPAPAPVQRAWFGGAEHSH